MANEYTVSITLRGNNQASAPVDQATRSVQRLRQETQSAQTAAQKLEGASKQLNSVLGAAFFGVTLAGVKGLAEGLFASGTEARRARVEYESYAATIGDTNGLLEQLRKTTRGVVSDTSLMQAASTQLSMGLAKNADDVERLMNIGATFAQARGEDMQASLENLNMILANQSYLRLDTLGISSAQVRELAEGYRRAGMDSSEAFTAAFMDVAEGKLPQMAAVADAAVTEFQRLSVAMDNWWSDFGERFATGVNGLIGIAKYGGEAIYRALFGWSPPSYADAQNTAAGYMGASNVPDFTGLPAGTPEGVMAMKSLADQLLAARQGLESGLFSPEAYRAQVEMVMRDSASLLRPYQMAMYDFMSLPALAPRASGGAAADPMLALIDEYFNTARGLDSERLRLLNESPFGRVGDVRLFSPDVAHRAETIAQQMAMIADRAEEIGANESMVNTMRGAADQAREFATMAQLGANALANASLSELFGQTSGGRLGEIDAAVLASLEAGGASQATIDALRTAMGLDTGQITQMSQQFDTEVVPLLEDVAATMGADAYTRMRRAYDDAVAGAAMTNTPTVNLPGLMGNYAYYGGGGGSPANSYTVQAGDTASAIAARFGVNVGAFGLANPSLIVPGQQLTWGGSGGGSGMLMDMGFDWNAEAMMAASELGTVVDESGLKDDMQSAVDTLTAGMDAAFARPYRVEMALDVTEINVSPTFRGALAQLVAELVRANGGTTPGQSGGTGRSTRTAD